MVPGMMEIILKYDLFFNDEEGHELLDSVVMIQNYSRHIENSGNIYRHVYVLFAF